MNDVHESLDRHHYQLLLALRDTGQLKSAADALSISPSAASHRLRQAERRLGIELAVPDGRSVRLTAAGTHLAAAAAVSEAALRAGEDASRWLDTTTRRTVRMALDFYDTAPWYERANMLSGVPFRVDVVRVEYGQSQRALSRRVVDVAVDVVPATVNARFVLADDELAAVVPASHPAAERGTFIPSDVASARYLTAGYTPRQGFEYHEFIEPAGVFPDEPVLIESVSTILRVVAAERGLSIQPRLALGPASTMALAVVPLANVVIPVRWVADTRPDPDDDTLELLAALTEAASLSVGEEP